MKNKKGLLIFVISIVLIVTFIIVVKQRLLLDNVKRGFFSKVNEIERNGNAHIIYNYYDPYGLPTQRIEQIGKDGIYYQSTLQDGNENIIINDSEKITYLTKTVGDDEYSVRYSDENLNVNIFGNSISDSYSLLQGYDFDISDVVSIKEEEYKGKTCYEIKMVSKDDDNTTLIAYINPQDNLPYGEKLIIINHDGEELVFEYEYLEISIGNVKEIPKINVGKGDGHLFP